MSNAYEAKKLDRETEEYKNFMRVAKRLVKLEYKVWKIVPDMNDPLRKFMVERDIGWCTIRLKLVMEPFYHRNNYTDGRDDWRARIGIEGMFKDHRGMPVLNTFMKVRPRMARKLIKAMNEVIIPTFYREIEQHRVQWEANSTETKVFLANIAKVNGLVKIQRREGYYHEPDATLKGCPMQLQLAKDKVEYSGEMTYDELAVMAKAMGWGK